MDIDLSKVIGYSRDSLQSRALMRAIIQDLYPGKIREMNILLDVYESGVPRQIKNDGNITDVEYARYIQKIVDDYGMQEQYAVLGLNAWIDLCLGNGTAERINYQTFSVANGVNSSNGNIAGGGYTKPIFHNNIGGNAPVVVNGLTSDYDVKNLGNGTAEITKYKGFDVEDTLVPNMLNGMKIVGIGENAYKACAGIKRLIIPEGIEYIKEGAFAECSELQEVALPTTLKQLGTKNSGYQNGAFSKTKIKSINLPNGLKSIGHSTFMECKELESVQLPDNVEVIGSHAFYRCKQLKRIEFPNSVKDVLNSAFEDCYNLTDVRLNEGLKKIDDEAFSRCSSIRIITIPSTVEYLGNAIFGYSPNHLVVSCYPGSRAIEYCRVNKIRIENART